MTTTEDNVQTNEPTEAATEVKNPTYLDLARATWKLGYSLSGWGDRDVFCVEGVNSYLRQFGLPELVQVDGNMELADDYVKAWYTFTTWTVTGSTDVANDQAERARLARSIRAYLRREQPKPREIMNEWLNELGVELIAPPAPPRHVGRYDVSYSASTEVNSVRIQEALHAAAPELNIRVDYVGRIA